MHTLTVAELAAGLRARKFSSLELTLHFLGRIERLAPELNAFVTVTAERALDDARTADEVLARGAGGPLTGVPIAHKDIFCTDGIRTTCGSRMLSNFVAPYDATVVERWRAAGTVLLGKTNMDEFAMGSSNETSFFGPVSNPWDHARVPGRLVGRLGRGRGRLPRACGQRHRHRRLDPPARGAHQPDRAQAHLWPRVALRDDRVRVEPRPGGRAHPFGRGCRAAAQRDGGVRPARFDERRRAGAGLRRGAAAAPRRACASACCASSSTRVSSPRSDAACATRSTCCSAQGAVVREVSLPSLPLSVPTYYVVAPAECSSNLSRFDGVRFGHRCESPRDLLDLYKRSRGEGFGAEVKRRIMTGTYVLSAGYYDAYYLKAQKVRALIAADFARAFGEVDVVLGPTAPTAAFELGAKTSDPITMYLNDIYTIGANLAGLPAISIPCGFVQEGGHELPVGLQLVGPAFRRIAAVVRVAPVPATVGLAPPGAAGLRLMRAPGMRRTSTPTTLVKI